MKNQP